MAEIKGHRRSFFAGVYGCFEYITENISKEPNAGDTDDVQAKVGQIITELNAFQDDIQMGIA